MLCRQATTRFKPRHHCNPQLIKLASRVAMTTVKVETIDEAMPRSAVKTRHIYYEESPISSPSPSVSRHLVRRRWRQGILLDAPCLLCGLAGRHPTEWCHVHPHLASKIRKDGNGVIPPWRAKRVKCARSKELACANAWV